MREFNENLRNIQARLREAIAQSGIKQNAIAKGIGVSYQTVSKYMNNDVLPTLDKLAKLCVLIGVSSDYILGITDF